jgi:NAD(P)-dependent dehydrogenase (short-subunit alcohol dehydrogenase family)
MKTVLVTGATSGLGLATAKALARQGVRVLVGGRNVPLAQEVAARLRALGSPQAQAVELSLNSFASTRAGATRVKQALAGARLDGLDCNAGLQQVARTRMTPDGFEETFAVNHLAHLLLLCLLWDELEGGRVLFIGSGMHDVEQVKAFGFRGAQWLGAKAAAAGESPPDTDQGQAGLDRYSNSKLANIATAFELARRLKAEHLVAMALDPGLMGGTALARDHGAVGRALFASVVRWVVPLLPFGSSPSRSGSVAAFMLTAPELASRSGLYLDFHRADAKTSPQARDPALARSLLDDSLGLLGLAESEMPSVFQSIESVGSTRLTGSGVLPTP